MVRAAALICCLLLAGCDDQKQHWSQGDIRAIANDDRLGVLENKIIDLQAKVEDLERKNLELRGSQLKLTDEVLTLRKSDQTDLKYNTEAFERLFKNDETFRQNVNWLLARNGGQQIPKVK